MVAAFDLISGLNIGILVISFYKRINSTSIKLLHIIIISLIFSAFRFFTHDYIMEPFRLITSFFAVGIILYISFKTVNWAALILSFSFGYAVWIISIILSPILALFFHMPSLSSNSFYMISIFTQILLGTIFYIYPKLKNKKLPIEEKEIKGIIYSSAGILIAICGGYFTRNVNIPEVYKAIAQVVLVFLLASIILGLIFAIRYFSKKHREKLEFENHIAKLQFECQENMQLYKDERTENHKYKYIVPAVASSCTTILSELEKIQSDKKIDSFDQLQNCISGLRSFSTDLDEEISNTARKNIINALLLPEKWYFICLLLEQFAKECENNNIVFTCKNSVSSDSWHELKIHTIPMTHLLTNLLSNAMKELNKTDITAKQIILRFFEEKGVFCLEVRDNAHEFPIHILRKLGEKGNSTNGTGDGYTTIFEILSEYKASLIVKEKKQNDKFIKNIKIIFDKKNNFIIRTNFRYDELISSNTPFEIEDNQEYYTVNDTKASNPSYI